MIGRGEELADLRREVQQADVRLLTLVGPPGVGKTRLALEVAHLASDEFAHGALFVDLTPIRDPALVIYALAQTLGLREGWERSPALDLPMVDRVKDVLRERALLLLLDNFEHVVEGATAVAELLGACPSLKVLATSRAPLRLQWEKQFHLAPLALPNLDHLPDVAALGRNPAVAMFVTRAHAVVPAFTLNEHNARVVADICARLDGLPLAIELVVGHVKTLPLPTILAQLERRLEFLTVAPRDLPVRQRTLRSAIAWSYDLLPPTEQALFRRLAVFASGAGPEGIRAVCSEAKDVSIDVHTLSALVDKNLLLWTALPEGSARYRMLGSLREFAWDQLQASGELTDMRARHARFFLELAETAEPKLAGPDDALWYARLEREHDNLQLALEWALDADPEVAVRYAGALHRFWVVRGHRNEGRAWVERALDRGAAASPAARAKALYAAAVMAQLQYDFETATKRIEECLALRTALGDKAGTAQAMWYLGNLALYGNDPAPALSLYEQSLALAREVGEKMTMAAALQSIGRVAREQGDIPRARTLLQEALALARDAGGYRATTAALLGLGEIALDDGDLVGAETAFTEILTGARKRGDTYNTAEGLEHLAYIADRREDFQRADALLGDALAVYRELGDNGSAAAILRRMGQVATRAGDTRRAATLIGQSLVLNRDLGHLWGIAKTLDAAGVLAAQLGRPERAAILLASAARLRETAVGPRAPGLHAFDRTHVSLGSKLQLEHTQAWEAGLRMSLEDVIEEAVVVLQSLSSLPVQPERKKAASPLSHREEEVARLVAQGLSNREIGKRLFISERTVDSHIEHILNKLEFASRAQIAAWAVKQGLEAPSPD